MDFIPLDVCFHCTLQMILRILFTKTRGYNKLTSVPMTRISLCITNLF